MSSTNVELGNVDYLYLQNINCNNGAGGVLTNQFSWQLPYIDAKQAPYMFIQVVQLYVDHDDGAGGAQPQHLRFINLHGNNTYATSGSSELAGLMERDTPANHWSIQGDSPMIQVPTNLNQLIFTINRNLTGDSITLGQAGSIDILVKIVRPQQGILTKNIMAANVKNF